MENSKALVLEFGEQTRIQIEEVSGKLGVSLDRMVADKSFALAWSMSSILQEEDGLSVDPFIPFIEIAESMTRDEIGVTFCFNTWRGGVFKLKGGDLSGALEIFGLVRELLGYLRRDDIGKILSANARKGASAKLANDPKQEAKRFVRECWDEWQASPDNYAGQASFARDMLDKCPVLKSQPSIENWCRKWKRAKPAS